MRTQQASDKLALSNLLSFEHRDEPPQESPYCGPSSHVGKCKK